MGSKLVDLPYIGRLVLHEAKRRLACVRYVVGRAGLYHSSSVTLLLEPCPQQFTSALALQTGYESFCNGRGQEARADCGRPLEPPAWLIGRGEHGS
jgi:hypothetical protein